MKLSDVVSAMHLSLYAEAPLLIFFGVWLAVGIHVFSTRRDLEAMGALPLDARVKNREEQP